MQENTERFDSWAIVELFGHQRIAGRVTEAQIGGGSFLRVDVPELAKDGRVQPSMTKYFGPSAIYAIHPVDETIARQAAASIERWKQPIPVAVPALDTARRQPALIGPGDDGEWDQGDQDHFDDDLPL